MQSNSWEKLKSFQFPLESGGASFVSDVAGESIPRRRTREWERSLSKWEKNFVRRCGTSNRPLSLDRKRRADLVEAGWTMSTRLAGDLSLFLYMECIASFIVTVICNINTTLCAECLDDVTIITPDRTPYRAGDELTCSPNGYHEPIYSWTVDGVVDSSTSTQVLREGEHVYVCTATHTVDNVTCTESDSRTVTAYSKYQTNTILLWKVLSVR